MPILGLILFCVRSSEMWINWICCTKSKSDLSLYQKSLNSRLNVVFHVLHFRIGYFVIKKLILHDGIKAFCIQKNYEVCKVFLLIKLVKFFVK